ncbi:uncharacterized protein TRUGW13939_11204 [Talaromyces rugulosus]|uniref:Protein kinase domain-containing protein n=1 Tax=Talaromyces rugulosus TaxID=121627 RepID=A0A7H8REA6_TALRU|nr:uncharacterized protein TRUGW13939_11204 [Talaromyces rugulosus]QKX64031.1 hypothetical protein TRUGW13939_11204 [Talaromyces rugulosus]
MSSSSPAIPRVFPTSGFDIIDAADPVEEETLPSYRPEWYYPVRLGEVLDGRYQVLAKLGYGVTSTVWLCRDLVWVFVRGIDRTHELAIYNHINSVETDHMGKSFIRQLLGHFHVRGPSAEPHLCLVLQPAGISVDQYLGFFSEKVMTLQDLKPCLRQVLGVLDFLHTEAHIIHTDLQLKNLLLPAGDAKTFSDLEEAEIEDPSPRKILDNGREIYLSQLPIPGNGLPLLSDFGEARFGNEVHNEDIMPNAYRAPEVVLKMNWDYKVDVWNVAIMAWDIVCRRTLFQGKNSDGIFDDRVHLAEMVAIMGSPVDFVQRSSVGSVFWDDNGKWKDLAPVPEIILDVLAADIQGDGKEGFLEFMRRALKWAPEDRPTARELLFDTCQRRCAGFHVTIFCRRKSAHNTKAKPNIIATITTIASLCRARGQQQQQHFTMALSLGRTPGFTRQINCTASRIYAANSSSSQQLQQQQRWFSQSLAPQAKGVEEFMPVKRPLEKSLKIRAKELSIDSMPTDLGLLPGTFIRPEGKNMPSIFREPRDRLRMEWVGLKQWFQNVAGTFAYHKYFFHGLPLELKARRQEAMRLHQQMCTEFARGNQDALKQICCTGLANNLIRRSRARGPGEKVSWNLLKYNRTPSTWFTGVHVVQDRSTQIPEVPESGVRQVIVRIASKQSTHTYTEYIDQATRQRTLVPSPEKVQDCTEYVVIQKLRIKGEEKPWQVWGYATPTTVDDLDSPFFSSELTVRERLEMMQDMVQGKR